MLTSEGRVLSTIQGRHYVLSKVMNANLINLYDSQIIEFSGFCHPLYEGSLVTIKEEPKISWEFLYWRSSALTLMSDVKP